MVAIVKKSNFVVNFMISFNIFKIQAKCGTTFFSTFWHIFLGIAVLLLNNIPLLGKPRTGVTKLNQIYTGII